LQALVLLADAQDDALGWLQCASRPEIALAVVSPGGLCRITIRVYRSELVPLGLKQFKDAHVLAIVASMTARLL